MGRRYSFRQCCLNGFQPNKIKKNEMRFGKCFIIVAFSAILSCQQIYAADENTESVADEESPTNPAANDVSDNAPSKQQNSDDEKKLAWKNFAPPPDNKFD
jgi:hypothetical protein